MTKNLVLLRGCPGAGKSSIAELFDNPVIACADDYFVDAVTGEYHFHAAQLKAAHASCRDKVERAMRVSEETIVVANTFTVEWEMQVYFDLAKAYGYNVHTLIVENRHGHDSVHNVPENKRIDMAHRLSNNIKLI